MAFIQVATLLAVVCAASAQQYGVFLNISAVMSSNSSQDERRALGVVIAVTSGIMIYIEINKSVYGRISAPQDKFMLVFVLTIVIMMIASTTMGIIKVLQQAKKRRLDRLDNSSPQRRPNTYQVSYIAPTPTIPPQSELPDAQTIQPTDTLRPLQQKIDAPPSYDFVMEQDVAINYNEVTGTHHL
ncbi:hypothetical protein B566_EDAN006502 [Ephemera danica]|nr:hypothetical protein B566_EDAN006502 [Ephemera danica]